MDGNVLKEGLHMTMMKTMKFDKKSKDWNLCTFYRIYMKGNIKTIQFIGMTDKESRGKGYLSWICTYCEDSCEMPLEDFLLWDVFYQLNFLMKSCTNKDVELEPYDCYEQANEWVKGDGNGSYHKELTDLTEYTPCGYYYS